MLKSKFLSPKILIIFLLSIAFFSCTKDSEKIIEVPVLPPTQDFFEYQIDTTPKVTITPNYAYFCSTGCAISNDSIKVFPNSGLIGTNLNDYRLSFNNNPVSKKADLSIVVMYKGTLRFGYLANNAYPVFTQLNNTRMIGTYSGQIRLTIPGTTIVDYLNISVTFNVRVIDHC
jgi:hypothetical protein